MFGYFFLSITFFTIALTQTQRYKDGPLMAQHHNQVKPQDYTDIIVHIIPHSHDDVGWLKTIDQYFYGSRNDIQLAGVQYVIDSVVQKLSQNQNYTFSMVQIAFVKRWWDQANETQRNKLKNLVQKGQVQFINAGWCMSDQATAYYQDIIDQMTVGLRWVNQTFDVQPTIGWHVDPFGHQNTQAAIFSKMGFNAWFFARIDYQDKIQRLQSKRMQTVMRPARTQQQIFTHVQYHHYSAPPGFNFDIKFNDEPIMDDKNLQGYNLDTKADNLVEYFQSQGMHYRTSNLIHTFGQDFSYIAANPWYKNIDKLIKKINNQPSYKTKLIYSTPGKYIEAIYKQGKKYPQKKDDFFPYADVQHGYWSGYYVSRTALKGMVRQYGRWLQSVRTFIGLEMLKNQFNFSNRQNIYKDLHYMEQSIGVLQHHDAVSGTAKQAVTNDYYLIGSQGKNSLQKHYFDLQKSKTLKDIGQNISYFSCQWNATKTQCNIYSLLQNGKIVLVQIYNPGSTRNIPIKILVPSQRLQVKNNQGQSLPGDIICSDSVDNKQCYLILILQLQQFTNQYLKIKKSSNGLALVIPRHQITQLQKQKSWNLGQGKSLLIQRKTHQFNYSWSSGNWNTFTLNHLYYQSYQGIGQKSGAYIFRPSNSTYFYPIEYSRQSTIYYFQGKNVLAIYLPGQKITTTLYFYKIIKDYQGAVDMITYVEPIKLNGQGKEIVMQIHINQIHNNDTFWTDSSGMAMQHRQLNIQPQYNLTVHQPRAGNYYPIGSILTIQDLETKKKASILTDRSQGGFSPKNGTLQIMIQRRTQYDDARGVGQPLNQKQPNGQGLSQYLRHTLIFDNNQRQHQKNKDQWPILSFAQSSSQQIKRLLTKQRNTIKQGSSNIKFYLNPLKQQGQYLMRLHNTYTQEQTITINLQNYQILQVTLGGNMAKKDWDNKRLRFKVEGQDNKNAQHNRITEQTNVKKQNEYLVKGGDIQTYLIRKA